MLVPDSVKRRVQQKRIYQTDICSDRTKAYMESVQSIILLLLFSSIVHCVMPNGPLKLVETLAGSERVRCAVDESKLAC